MATATARATPQEPASTEPVVVFEHVSIGFDGHQVLDDISLTVMPGQTRVLLGPAGSGKSVLLKLANGLMKPDSGKVFLFGNDIQHMRDEDLYELRRRVGMVFQEGALFDSLTVKDNVAFRLEEEHDPEEEIVARVTEALRFVELEHTLLKFPSQLSGGMRRRVAIARALITQPDLLLYDSPTGGLDPITSTTIIELIVKQRDVNHTSSLLVTHRLQDAFMLATHCFDREKNAMELIAGGQLDPSVNFLVLNETKIVFDGTTHDLVHSDDEFLKQYLS